MTEYQSASDLFNIKRYITPKGALNERAGLIKYFLEQEFTFKNGKKLTPAFIGQRLAHYDISQLYALQSGYRDRLNRDGKVSATKYFWFTTKTE